MEHLFFNCPYSFRVWTNLTRKIGINWQQQGWQGTVNQMINETKGKTLRSMIARIVFNVAIYSIWRERNARWATNTYIDAVTTTKEIKRMVSYRLAGLRRIPRTLGNFSLQREWNLPISIFNDL